MGVKVVNTLKTLIIAYVITGILLLLIAFGMFKFQMTYGQTTAAIIVTYALSCFAGGYILARVEKSKRLLWGIGFGILYVAILSMISLIIGKGTGTDITALVRAFIICGIAGGVGAFATLE